MKKLMILAVVATLAMGTSSCKKSGICSCTVAGVTVDSPASLTKAECDASNTAAQAVGGSCKLK